MSKTSLSFLSNTRTRRLVQEHNLWIGQEFRSNIDSLSLSSRYHHDWTVRHLGQAQLLNNGGHFLVLVDQTRRRRQSQ